MSLHETIPQWVHMESDLSKNWTQHISKGIFYKINFLGLGVGESPTYGLRF
jgi:hypothetical protein